MVHIYKNRRLVPDELIKALSSHGSATVHEAMGRIGAMAPEIKPLERTMKLCGRALTVRCHAGDNIMLIKAISMLQPGDVLVVDTGKVHWAGPFGEVLATECMVRGAAGMVIDGSVRDSNEIISLGFPVFSAGISICGTSKATLGQINHPVSCGGVVVQPGDVILGDGDGVVVIPADMTQLALDNANRRVEKERIQMEELRAGGSVLMQGGFQQVLDRLGCVEE